MVRRVMVIGIAVILGCLFSMSVSGSQEYIYLDQIGAHGSGDGEFLAPYGVTTDELGMRIWVTDSSRNNVQYFDWDTDIDWWNFSGRWGATGTGDGNFTSPRGIALDSHGNVTVVDSGNNRTQKFSGTGTWLATNGETGGSEGRFRLPSGIGTWLNNSDFYYIADTGNNRVQGFVANNAVFDTAYSSGLNAPAGVAYDYNHVYVADTNNNRIVRLNYECSYEDEWGGPGPGPGQFSSPAGITTDHTVGYGWDLDISDVYVADSGNHRIQKFDKDGNFLAAFGTAELGSPTGIVVDDLGWVYVTDPAGYCVRVFRPGDLTPEITSLAPSSGTTGVGLTLVVQGKDFHPESKVWWDTAFVNTTFVSRNQINATIPASAIRSPGTHIVRVYNYGYPSYNPIWGSNWSGEISFPVINPVPVITGISPKAKPAGSPKFTLTVNGRNFTSNSTVQWKGANRTTHYVSRTKLTAKIPAKDVKKKGRFNVTVFNDGPGGGVSTVKKFRVT